MRDAIAEQTIWLLENEAERHAMRKRAYLYSRNMVWKSVAQDYMRSFQKARAERLWNPRLISPNPVNHRSQSAARETGPPQSNDR